MTFKISIRNHKIRLISSIFLFLCIVSNAQEKDQKDLYIPEIIEALKEIIPKEKLEETITEILEKLPIEILTETPIEKRYEILKVILKKTPTEKRYEILKATLKKIPKEKIEIIKKILKKIKKEEREKILNEILKNTLEKTEKILNEILYEEKNNKKEKIEKITKEILKEKTEEIKELPKEEVKEEIGNILSKQFSSLFSGVSQNGIGTYASLDPENGVMDFSYNKIQENSILGIKIKGGSSDDILSLFTNSKLNTNISLSFNYHILNNKGSIRVIDYNKTKKKREALMTKIKKENTSIENELERKNLNNTKKEKVAKDLPYKISGYSFNWFSLGYNMKYDNFNLYNKQEVFDKQIINDTYLSHELSINYSYYTWKEYDNWKSGYISGGVIFKYKNNLEDLGKVEILDKTSTISGNIERTETKKYNAFVGDYKKDFNEVTMFVDGYYFLANNNIGALHILPKVKFAETKKPIWNIDFGYLLTFKNKEKDKSNINVELFYQLIDISNSLSITDGVYDKNNIGLRVTLPINFN